MLRAIEVRGFKSLAGTGRIELAPLTVLFGPNAAGKSNFLDAIQVLSRIGSERTLADALGAPIRGLALEAFTFPRDGLPGLLKTNQARFAIECEIGSADPRFKYAVEVAIHPRSGTLTTANERLSVLGKSGQNIGDPRIERQANDVLIRRKSKPGRPVKERADLPYVQLADRRYSGTEYRPIEEAREELSSWKTYYLDPRVAMRSPQSPQDVTDIGPLGEHLAPYLYRLRSEKPRVFDGVKRTLRTLIRTVDDLEVDLDSRRGVLDVEVVQNGTRFSSRIVSEGTLRVLALACVASNPWGGGLIAFEEPENGVHPQRIELIAQILVSMASRGEFSRQIVVTTHSPLFCGAVLRYAKEAPERVAMYNVFRDTEGTRLKRFEPFGPLFENEEIQRGLASSAEDTVFEGLALRGLLDG